MPFPEARNNADGHGLGKLRAGVIHGFNCVNKAGSELFTFSLAILS